MSLLKTEGKIKGILNPEFAEAIYYGLQIIAATLVSRFCSST